MDAVDCHHLKELKEFVLTGFLSAVCGLDS